jgi:D-alanyl-D-alanine carboxypeptidase
MATVNAKELLPLTRTSIVRRSAALLLLSAVLLAGCSRTAPSTDPAGTPSAGANAAGTTAAAAAYTALAVEPGSASLSPGAKKQVTVYGIKKDQSRQPLTGDKSLTFATSAQDVVAAAADGTLSASPLARTGQTAVVTVQYGTLKKEIPITIKRSLDDTIAVVGGVPTVTNADAIDVVVNKKRSMPATYVPKLVEPNVPFTFKEKSEKRLMRPEAAQALEQLFAAAKQDGITLYGISAYRSYATQQALYKNYVNTQGEKEASQFSAHPGQSEHQTGLAIDVGDGNPKCAVEQCFADSSAAKWLAAHAADYGFIIRYPKGKEAITGYEYEPWHIRYVGVDVAKEIAKQGVTLEEYFQDAIPAGTSPAPGGGTTGNK